MTTHNAADEPSIVALVRHSRDGAFRWLPTVTPDDAEALLAYLERIKSDLAELTDLLRPYFFPLEGTTWVVPDHPLTDAEQRLFAVRHLIGTMKHLDAYVKTHECAPAPPTTGIAGLLKTEREKSRALEQDLAAVKESVGRAVAKLSGVHDSRAWEAISILQPAAKPEAAKEEPAQPREDGGREGEGCKRCGGTRERPGLQDFPSGLSVCIHPFHEGTGTQPDERLTREEIVDLAGAISSPSLHKDASIVVSVAGLRRLVEAASRDLDHQEQAKHDRRIVEAAEEWAERTEWEVSVSKHILRNGYEERLINAVRAKRSAKGSE